MQVGLQAQVEMLLEEVEVEHLPAEHLQIDQCISFAFLRDCSFIEWTPSAVIVVP